MPTKSSLGGSGFSLGRGDASAPIERENGKHARDPLLTEYEELADAIVFWEAAAARANSPSALAYAQHTLVRLKDKADRLIEEIEEC